MYNYDGTNTFILEVRVTRIEGERRAHLCVHDFNVHCK